MEKIHKGSKLNININYSNGITMISLIITIIVLLILAGVSIVVLTGDNAIITKANYAKFANDVKSLEEQLKLKQQMSKEDYSGLINEILNVNSKYNNKLIIQNGELKYTVSSITTQEKQWFEQLGIEQASDYYKITFNANNNTEETYQMIKAGEKAQKPANPNKQGNEFIGWYYLVEKGSGENITYEEKEFDFTTEIAQDYSLYANYKGEAILGNYTKIWNTNYKTNVTSISFKKSEILVPNGAIDLGDIKANKNCSEIRLYAEDDGLNQGTYKLTVISNQTIYANADSWGLFGDFTNLNSINFENFNTSRTQYMTNMFFNCTNLTNIKFNTSDTANILKFDTSNVITMDGMFHNCKNITNLDLSNFNTSKITDMSYIFKNCLKLETLDISSFNTSNVTNMSSMFVNNQSLKSLNLKNFDTSNVVDMNNMFYQCAILKTLDLKNFNTSKVTNMNAMFYQCDALEELDISNFNTSQVTNMGSMFFSCDTLKSINVKSFNTENVETMKSMFNACTSLEKLDISNFDTRKATQMRAMFHNCGNLSEILVGPYWTTENAEITNMFNACGVQNVTLKK